VILFRAANLAAASSAAISMAEERVAKPLAFDTWVAAQPAPAVLMWSAARALPGICGSVLHLFRPARAQAGETFAREMSIFALCCPDACGF
ncbi:MAG: hypothetical protein M3O72_00600, partial [Verrucomicrobiota bacterium]|nr:hypothetical protein [Verrucomicrobiota bacterium]